MRNRRSSALCVSTVIMHGVLLLGAAHCAWAQEGPLGLAERSLEELANIEVSTVSRVPEPRAIVPAAAHVITRDQIRRSGANTIPEALRLVPGLHVARIDSGKWAIGARGFTDRLARSTLVMIDGRPVYSTLFAGTYWEVQDTLLQDVDRIEVILGPGGTLWGANAVNGIINIITRHSRDTEGVLVTAGTGTTDRGLVGIRYGASVGTNFNYRVYGKFQSTSPGYHADAADFDQRDAGQAGFRTDWTAAGGESLTVQGDLYRTNAGERDFLTVYSPPANQPVDGDVRLAGGNLLGRWTRTLGGTDIRLQALYDRTERVEATFEETRDTFDIDFQQTLSPFVRHRVVWGGGYRQSAGDTASIPTTLRFIPEDWTDRIGSVFVEDEIELVPDRFTVTAGVRMEHNRYSGFEVQPSIRTVWRLSVEQTLVASITRAVRTPSRVERDLELSTVLDPATPLFLRLEPNPDFEAEKLVAYELGYRVQPDPRVRMSVSTFFNHYTDVLSTESGQVFAETDPPPLRLVFPLEFGNGIGGNLHGLEVEAQFRATESWEWSGSYSLLRVQLTPEPGSRDVSQEARGEGLSPVHQFALQSSWDLPGGLQADWMLRYVSELPEESVPAYATSDVRLGWSPTPGVELSLIGRNLHEAHHLEFSGGSSGNVEVQRGLFARITAEW